MLIRFFFMLREAGLPVSLTEHLSQFCADDLGLDVIKENWQRPLPGETVWHGRYSSRRVYVREINLSCRNRPLLYARSLFPRATYHHCRQPLARLGDRPLGEWLFNDPGISRLLTQAGRIGRYSRLYRLALAGQGERPPHLWGRRSVYTVKGYPLLVIEILLPHLLQCIAT